jgi:hypothetical protein
MRSICRREGRLVSSFDQPLPAPGEKNAPAIAAFLANETFAGGYLAM